MLPAVLPIDLLLPEIVASLHRAPNLVIEAAPGAGKTTRVPPALLAFGGDVLVLEPRRIAARMAARQVAKQFGEQPGQTVGYQVRFEEVAGPRTRLRFLTEGVLTRRMISDPELSGVSVVVLDEFHERHLETDLALALLRRLQTTRRPDLRIVVMSATLDPAPVAHFLGGCPTLKSEGRLFELTVSYTAYSTAPLEEQVAAAVEQAITEEAAGDVLVFLPGAGEIRRALRACESVARRAGLLIAPLYGELSPAEQDLAVEPSARRKVILATNLAESSITIEGVRVVIDSGLARIASDSPWTGLPSLEVRRIGKASARQRAGRAGRTAPGRAIRLYTAEDFERRADRDEPEIVRRELSQMCLQLEAAGARDIAWLDAPPAEALRAAEELLDRLKARGPEAAKLARLPTHPRLARLLLDAERHGAGDHGCRVAALLSGGQRIRTFDDEPDARTRQVYEQLRRLVRKSGTHDETAIAKALLAAFPDRVGKRRANGTVQLSNGVSAAMANPPGEFLVAVEVHEGAIRLACAIEPEWLLDLFPERVLDKSFVEWNRQAERVEAVSAIYYDQVAIDESRSGRMDDEAAARLLATKVTEAGMGRFVDTEELAAFLARVAFASEHSGIANLNDADVEEALATLCYGLRSFAQVEKNAGGLIPLLQPKLDAALLEQTAPSKLVLPNGRATKVHYETGKPPWVASRLQDFFGLTESPRVGRGKVPLVVHLLAPNQRPVQTTTDLAGFWERLYPQLRRELGRRYPRHAWPEKPA